MFFPLTILSSIKQVEDVFEKYWNDHRMDHTVEFLVTMCLIPLLTFSKILVPYWDEQGWSRIGHQLEDLFRRLDEFLSYSEIQDLHIVRDMMKYDYLAKQKYKPRKTWWEPTLSKKDRSHYYQMILHTPSVIGEM